MVKHPSKLEVVQTNTLQPNEWLEIILGKEQILDIVAKSKNEWRIDPAKLPSPSSIKTDTEIHSTFLIGTVYFPSLFIKEKLFGNPLSSLRRAEIHGILQVVSEISEPATPVDRILAVVAIVHWIESLETSNPGVRFVRAVDPTTLDSSPIFDLYISARFDWQHYIQFDPWWDTKELFSSDEARDEVNAWFRNSPEEKVEVPDYYKLKPHNM
ncbi:hypothetical protein FB446DRAFT_735286 [Lentinula raphanica]|nr:hypothetical protein FB446DRAFT_735286 [Lentinula raphanica]